MMNISNYARDGAPQRLRPTALRAIDREKYRAELIRAAGGNVESASRQDFARDPLHSPPSVEPGRDPWADYQQLTARSGRIYAYRSILAPDPHELTRRATGYRCQIVYWYDLREHGPIILPVTERPIKILEIPAITAFLAAFWVIGGPRMH